VSYRIAFFSDTHIGYGTKCRIHPPTGLNYRVRDGYLGLRETVDQIIEAEPDVVLHGGDLFHRSHPGVGDIAWVRRQLERFHEAGIPVLANTGNHDFANDRGKSPATAAVHDPGRNINMVTEPLRLYTPVDGLNIHMISHIGLAAAERAIPEPVDGEVNVFVSHGAAQIPGHPIFACVDSPGEAVVGYDILTMPWNVSLLGHYHGMDPLPGFSSGDTGQVWYAGSLLRRGFSDPEGGRGWLMATVNDDGSVSIERKFVTQRPQYDLPFIDAAGLSGSEVEEQIRQHLDDIDINNSIIRQRVVNCSLAVRKGVDTSALSSLTKDSLTWQLEFVRPALIEFQELSEKEQSIGSLSTAKTSDLPSMWSDWFDNYSAESGLSQTLQPIVKNEGSKLLDEVSEKEGLSSTVNHVEENGVSE
jgi:DNA repair exonuclease SbcCD nuclease subunit